jgi:hypothetical protein
MIDGPGPVELEEPACECRGIIDGCILSYCSDVAGAVWLAFWLKERYHALLLPMASSIIDHAGFVIGTPQTKVSGIRSGRYTSAGFIEHFG